MADQRDLSLSPRIEGKRDKIKQPITIFPLISIKKHFDENIVLIEKQFSTAEILISAGKKSDAEDVWRSQIVFLDSALDFYIHEITKYGIMNIFEDTWPKNDKYNKLKVDMRQVEIGLKNTEDSECFKDFVNELNEKKCFMSYEKIKEQLTVIGLNFKKIEKAAFNGAVEKFESKVEGLFKRRNMIAHQSDREHATAERNEISRPAVEGFISDTKKIVEAIHKIASEKV